MLSATSNCRLLTGIQPASITHVIAPMETVLSILVSVLAFIVTPILAWLIGVMIFAIPLGILAIGIAQGSQTWESEDPPYVNVNLRVKPAERSITRSRHHCKRQTRP